MDPVRTWEPHTASPYSRRVSRAVMVGQVWGHDLGDVARVLLGVFQERHEDLKHRA